MPVVVIMIVPMGTGMTRSIVRIVRVLILMGAGLLMGGGMSRRPAGSSGGVGFGRASGISFINVY